MHTDFGESKQAIIESITRLRAILEKSGKDLELDFSPLTSKLIEAVEQVHAEKFRIAMFGAYSDGKSSLLSALTGRTDVKIAPCPTTDKVTVYDGLADYLIVDTPGLFSGVFDHEMKTRAYISEAHMVLYVVEAMNPLKESHQEAVRWLLSDLKKLPVTLFVINKMDDVTDLDDDEDFQESAEIKSAEIFSTLQRFASVTERPRIACVAAAPDGKPFEAWQKNLEEYERLSHIGSARAVLAEFISRARDGLQERVGASVVCDVADRALRHYSETQNMFLRQLDIAENHVKEQEKNLNALRRNLTHVHRNIREDIIAYRNDLLSTISATSNYEQLKAARKREIGEDAYVVKERIEAIEAKHSEQILKCNTAAVEGFEETNSSAARQMEMVAKKLGAGVSKVSSKLLNMSQREVGDLVLKARNKLAKLIGKKLPFNPHGALKWAKWLQKFAKVLKWLPAIAEALESISNEIQATRFRKSREKAENELDGLFHEWLDAFTWEGFISAVDSALPELEMAHATARESRDKLKELLAEVENAQSLVVAVTRDLGGCEPSSPSKNGRTG